MDRLESVVSAEQGRLTGEKLERVQRATRLITDLKNRGVLKKQEYVAPTSGDFGRRYLLAPKSESIAARSR